MTDCHQIEPLVTPYVDGAISPADADVVDRHLGACRSCLGRVRAEQAVQALIGARRPALVSAEPPAALRARCARLATQSNVPVWRARLAPLALAACLILAVAGAFLYELSSHSTRVMAAELTADHLKCFRVLNTVLGTHHEADRVERDMAAGFAWPVRLPEHPEREGLELVGARPCVFPEGRIAHIMYLHHGNPVSLFMLPDTARTEGMLDVLGHRAAIWTVGKRTFVLVASEPRAEVEKMTSFVHAELR
jgi:anti-sigma factor RsiW